ncbi:MAG: leucine-rich repeat protein [Firmicutes bacterium]|nr:leucine-rich repeat protein [Bacillota bacterium]
MKTTNVNKKKLLLVVMIAIIACLGLVTVGIINRSTNSVVNATQNENSEVFSSTFYTNVDKSMDILDYVMSEFRAEFTDARGERAVVYCDNFSGRWIDESGKLNIGTVDGSQISRILLSEAHSGQVTFRHMRYSLNQLNEIKDAVVLLMQEYGIFITAIYERYNFVGIYTTCYDYANQIRLHLQKLSLYSEFAVNFFIGPNNNELNSNTAYGGDRITGNRRIGGEYRNFNGTIGVNLVCNRTGDLGVLTNYHVVPENTRAYFGNAFMGYSVRGEMGRRRPDGTFIGSIDAAFIQYSNQFAWQHTTRARINNSTFSNIRLGNESQIVEGAPVRKFGQITGNTSGRIDNINATIDMTHNNVRRTITNSIRHTNAGRNGDSGGPLYIVSGGSLYLVGIHFGNSGWLVTRGYASRMSEIMRLLEVTPIVSNTFFNITYLNSNSVRVDGKNTGMSWNHIIPSRVFGRNVTQIASEAFPIQYAEVTVPSTVNYIGANAFHTNTRVTWHGRYEFRGHNLIRYLDSTTNVIFPSYIAGREINFISVDAFAYNGITSVAIPSSVIGIGFGAFRGNNNLHTITIPFVGRNRLGNDAVHFGYIFGASNWSNQRNFIPPSLRYVNITGGTTIGAHAFTDASNIVNINLPNTLTTISNNAFTHTRIHTRITKMTIPASVTHIDSWAFWQTTSLRELTINRSGSIITLGTNVFLNSALLTESNTNAVSINFPNWAKADMYTAVGSPWRNVFVNRLGIFRAPRLPSNPTVMPQNLQATVGDRLGDIALPSTRWSWSNSNAVINAPVSGDYVWHTAIYWNRTNIHGNYRYTSTAYTILIRVFEPPSEPWQYVYSGFSTSWGNMTVFSVNSVTLFRLNFRIYKSCCCFIGSVFMGYHTVITQFTGDVWDWWESDCGIFTATFVFQSFCWDDSFVDIFFEHRGGLTNFNAIFHLTLCVWNG